VWCHTNLRRRYRCCLGLFYVPRTVYIRNTETCADCGVRLASRRAPGRPRPLGPSELGRRAGGRGAGGGYRTFSYAQSILTRTDFINQLMVRYNKTPICYNTV